ncbi:MAG: NADH-quinone oxidoreductase subunit J [Actinobacteria bacterium]|nr:NADH-quinone oxidoreductase subunit J [Actinomycetota bacterium]|tara:strand:- start:59 stop:442 length:384 start_codon:yes stop_codon:yes gene_type:complete
MLQELIASYNYIIVVVIMMIGLWAMLAKQNLIKKCIGMAIFQTGIILFYISMGAKKGSTLPILEHAHDGAHHAVVAAHYANPLTQILMLTAIVVGVATLGVALTLAQKVYQQNRSYHEDKILEKLSK